MKPNFLIFELCDNDFGQHIREAVEYAVAHGFYESAGTDPVWWKAYVIQFVCASSLMLWYQPEDMIEHTKAYLENLVKVYATNKFPTYPDGSPMDNDGGSVILDLHTMMANQF